MSAITSPPPLSPALARQVFAELCESLPPPSTCTPEARHARQELAKDAVVALQPADAWEVSLAVRIVGANAHAIDSLRLAALALANGDMAERTRCLAQAASMSRQSDSGYRALQRRQANRDKQLAETHPAGCWFRAQPEPATAPEPAPTAAPSVPFEAMTEAEQYAVTYPDRARRIRAAGGLPQGFNAGPPEPELLAEIVASTSPILRALDPSTLMAAE